MSQVSHYSISGLVEEEATIVGTAQSSYYENSHPSSLVDGIVGTSGWTGCAHTHRYGPPWFSLELDAPRTVTKVQIARRGSYNEQAQNVLITIGPSREYDASETLCLPEIPELDYGDGGLVDYPCIGGPKQGKYVKISRRDAYYLVVCEVKVFIRAEIAGTPTSTTMASTTLPTTTPTGLRKTKTVSLFLT